MFENLILKSKKGCTESKEIILSSLKPLIIASISKHYYGSDSFEDMIQEGYLKVLELIDDYDFDRKVHFPAYAKVSLKYFYLNKFDGVYIESLNVKNFDNSKEEKIDLIESDDMDILDRIIMSQGNNKLYWAYEELSPREKEVVNLYYIKDLNMKKIAKILNLSYRTVVNTKVNAIKKLKSLI